MRSTSIYLAICMSIERNSNRPSIRWRQVVTSDCDFGRIVQTRQKCSWTQLMSRKSNLVIVERNYQTRNSTMKLCFEVWWLWSSWPHSWRKRPHLNRELQQKWSFLSMRKLIEISYKPHSFRLGPAELRLTIALVVAWHYIQLDEDLRNPRLLSVEKLKGLAQF